MTEMLYMQSTKNSETTILNGDIEVWEQKIWHENGSWCGTNKCYSLYDYSSSKVDWPMPTVVAGLTVESSYAFGDRHPLGHVAYRFKITCTSCLDDYGKLEFFSKGAGLENAAGASLAFYITDTKLYRNTEGEAKILCVASLGSDTCNTADSLFKPVMVSEDDDPCKVKGVLA